MTCTMLCRGSSIGVWPDRLDAAKVPRGGTSMLEVARYFGEIAVVIVVCAAAVGIVLWVVVEFLMND